MGRDRRQRWSDCIFTPGHTRQRSQRSSITMNRPPYHYGRRHQYTDHVQQGFGAGLAVLGLVVISMSETVALSASAPCNARPETATNYRDYRWHGGTWSMCRLAPQAVVAALQHELQHMRRRCRSATGPRPATPPWSSAMAEHHRRSPAATAASRADFQRQRRPAER